MPDGVLMPGCTTLFRLLFFFFGIDKNRTIAGFGDYFAGRPAVFFNLSIVLPSDTSSKQRRGLMSCIFVVSR